MSDMSKPKEARSWLYDWQCYARGEEVPGAPGMYIPKHGGAETALRRVKHCAREQRANFETACFSGRWPGNMREEEYRQAIEILEAAISELQEMAEEQARARDAREREAADRAEAEHCRILREFTTDGRRRT